MPQKVEKPSPFSFKRKKSRWVPIKCQNSVVSERIVVDFLTKISWSPAKNTLGWELGKMDSGKFRNEMVAFQLLGKVTCLPAGCCWVKGGG